MNCEPYEGNPYTSDPCIVTFYQSKFTHAFSGIFQETSRQWTKPSPQWLPRPRQVNPTDAPMDSLCAGLTESVWLTAKCATSDQTVRMVRMNSAVVKLYEFAELGRSFLSFPPAFTLNFSSCSEGTLQFRRWWNLWLEDHGFLCDRGSCVPLVTWPGGEYSRFRRVPSSCQRPHPVSKQPSRIYNIFDDIWLAWHWKPTTLIYILLSAAENGKHCQQYSINFSTVRIAVAIFYLIINLSRWKSPAALTGCWSIVALQSELKRGGCIFYSTQVKLQLLCEFNKREVEMSS